jgi:hypothetical protein
MNHNDAERYFWRTGHARSADYRLFRKETTGAKLTNRTIILLAGAFAITAAMLFLLR